MANQRLLINYTGNAADNKPTLEQVKQSLGILTRRYGKVERTLTVREFLGMLVGRTEIDNDFKIKVSHTNFHIMFGHGGKRYFVIPPKNEIDYLSFGRLHPDPEMVSRIEVSVPGAMVSPVRGLSRDFKGISINQELVIPPAVKSTIDKYLKD
jgi:hypothetical protein